MRNRKLVIGCGVIAALLFCWIMATAQSRGLLSPAQPIPTSTLITPTFTPTVMPSPTATVPVKKTPTPTSIPSIPQRKLDEWDYIEMPADDLRELWGEPLKAEKVGEDFRGEIIEWIYEDVIVTLKRWELHGVTCYRVHEIRVR